MSKAVNQAYKWIRGRILSGEYEPGSHLKEEHIAEEACVSRTPVREALRRLSNEHFVKFVPNQGAFVATWKDEDVEVIFELRAMLEGYSAWRAATRITDEQIAELERCADSIEHLSKTHTLENYRSTIEYNRLFHSTIIEAAGSERIRKVLSWLIEVPVILRTIDRYSAEDIQRSNHHHRELIAAFRSKDGQWARSVMEAHLRAARQIYLSRSGPVSEDNEHRERVAGAL